MTEAEFREQEARRTTAVRHHVRRWLERGQSPLIREAIARGWSRSLEDIARDICRRHAVATGKLPSLQWLDRITIPKADRDYYASHGQPHLRARMTGDAA